MECSSGHVVYKTSILRTLSQYAACEALKGSPRAHVAEPYLKYAATIDVHNQIRSGSCALKDLWHNKNPGSQLTGV